MYSVVQAELTRDEVDDVSVGVGVDTLLILIGIDDQHGRRGFSFVRLRDQPFFVSSMERAQIVVIDRCFFGSIASANPFETRLWRRP